MSAGSRRDGHDGIAAVPARRPSYGRLGAVAGGVVVVALLFQLAGRGLERRLGILPVGEPFTELYFARATDLPATVRPGQVLRLAFVIDNREGRSYHYRWSVVAVAGARRTVLERGSVTVADGRSRLTPLEVAGRVLHGASTVEVRLDRPAQSIDLHVKAG